MKTIAVLLLTTAAFAGPASAPKAHHVHPHVRHAPTFDMKACIAEAQRIDGYGLSEAGAYCADKRVGV